MNYLLNKEDFILYESKYVSTYEFEGLYEDIFDVGIDG